MGNAPPDTFTHVFHSAPDAGASPTLLLLHGTGGDEHDLVDLGRTLAPNANLLGVRGRVLEGTMPRFFRRLSEGVFDEADLRLQTNALADFVSAASTHYSFDSGRVWAVGYSNGANIAGALLFLKPGTLAGGVLLRAMVPLVPDNLPKLNAAPVLLCAGQRDPIAPPAETERLQTLLTSAGASVTVNYENAGHGITPQDVNTTRQWMAAALTS